MLKDGMYYEEADKKADQKTYKMITKLYMKVNYIKKKLIILQILHLQKAIFMDCQKCIKVK